MLQKILMMQNVTETIIKMSYRLVAYGSILVALYT